MSVASEWAKCVAERQRPGFHLGDSRSRAGARAVAVVTDAGELHLNSDSPPLSAEQARAFGYWLLHTFGEETT